MSDRTEIKDVLGKLRECADTLRGLDTLPRRGGIIDAREAVGNAREALFDVIDNHGSATGPVSDDSMARAIEVRKAAD